MKKFWVVSVLGLALVLGGCASKKASTASSSELKTVITTKQYTTAQLQTRYVKIVDAVVQPLDLASYSKPTAEIKQAAETGKQTIESVDLQLADNSSQAELTKALQALGKSATTMLTAMTGSDQTAYNNAAKAFMNQTSTIAKTYFNGQLPQKLTTYSQRMSNKASSSSSSASSSTTSNASALSAQ